MFGSMGQSAIKNLGNGGEMDGDVTITGDLEVQGGISLSVDEVIQGTSTIDVTNTEALLVRKNDDGGDVFVVDTTNKRVGISATPSSLLQIGTRGTGSAITPSGDGLVFDFYNTGNPYTRKGSIISNSADSSEARLSFWTTASSSSASAKMTIDGSGNIGIGTSSPDTKLDIVGSDFAGASLKIERTGDGENDDSAIRLNRTGTVDANDRIGGIYFQDNDTSLALIRGEKIGTNDGRLDFIVPNGSALGNTTNPVLTIQNDRVGIGEVSPSGKLHVKETAGDEFFTFANGNGIGLVNNVASHGIGISASQSGSYGGQGSSALIVTEGGGSANAGTVQLVHDGTIGFTYKGGSVGIGTSDPSNRMLKVLQSSGDGSAEISTNDTSNAFLKFGTDSDGTERGGFVGIDYSDQVLRLNYGSGFDGTNNGLAIGASSATFAGSLTSNGNILSQGASAPSISVLDTTNNASIQMRALDSEVRFGTTSNHPVKIGTNDSYDVLVLGTDKSATFAGDITTSKANATGNSIILQQSLGSIASPSTSANTNILGKIQFVGKSTNDTPVGAEIKSVITSSVGSAKNMPASLVFSTQPVGGTDLTTALTLDSSQNATFTGDVTTNERLIFSGTNDSIVASAITPHSNGFIYIAGGSAGLVIGDDATNSRIQISNDAEIRHEIAGSEKMRLTSTGLGIGTSSPDAPLEIETSTQIDKDTILCMARITGHSNAENDGNVPSAGTSLEFYNSWVNNSPYSVGRISGRAYQGYNGGLQFDVADNSGNGESNFTTALSIKPDTNATFAGSVTSNALLSNTSSTYDIGSSSNLWRDAYLKNGGRVYFGDTGTYVYGSSSLDVLSFAVGANERFKLDVNSRISLSNNDASDKTTLLGYEAGSLIASGDDENTMIGHQAGLRTTGGYNTYVGADAGLGASGADAFNVGIGRASLFAVTTGNQNTVIGNRSGLSLTTGQKNVIIGSNAGNATTDVDDAVIIGETSAIANMTSGADGTVAIGKSSLSALTSGASNTAVGYQTGNDITIGSNNTILGYQAGATGTHDITGGSNNTLIGMQAKTNNANASNQTVIGKGATGRADNSVTLGNTETTQVYVAPHASNGGATQQLVFRDDADKGIINYDHNNGMFKITVEGTEHSRFASSGDLVLMHGGVNFLDAEGTSASSDANTLDDYEEGTFTAVLTGSTSGTVSTSGHFYTKIGNIVTFQIHFNNIGTGLSGNISITGLPFTSAHSARTPVSTFLNYQTGVGHWIGFVNGGATTIAFGKVSLENQDNVNITDANFNAYSDLQLSGTYRV